MRRSWLRLFWMGVVLCVALVGYLVSSGIGDRLLHEEIETQLGRLLEGPVEIAQVELHFLDGFRVEAHGFEAYPHPDGGVPGLRARRVLAWVDLLAVLVGRLELSTLVLEGPQVRIEQRADGSFVGLPLPPIPASDDGSSDESILEAVAQQLESLDPIATAFLDDFRAADRIELVDGAATWIDHRHPTTDGTPRELRIELVSGLAVRDWLSETVVLDFHGVFLDGRHKPFPFEIGGQRQGDSPFAWNASLSQIPLAAAQTTFTSARQSNELTGTLDAEFTLTRSAAGTHHLRFDGSIRRAVLRLRRSGTRVLRDNLAIHVEVESDQKRIRVSSGGITGEHLSIEFKGAIARPVRPRSRTRLETRMVGAEVSSVRDLAMQFEAEYDMAYGIASLTERVEAGQIRYLEAAGTADLQRWIDLAAGRTRELPDGFLFGGGIDAVLFDAGAGEKIENLTGEIQWSEDNIALRNMTGLYRGAPLPEMNAVFEGVSHLIRTAESVEPVSIAPPDVPGVQPLLNIFEPGDPGALPSVRAIGLAIDRLDHPIFRFPLRDLRVLIEPLRKGLQMNIREGTWGGAGIEGDVVWFADPDAPTIDARLTLREVPLEAPVDGETQAAEAAATPSWPANRWGSGRFEMQFRPRPSLPFETATGFFRLDDADLIGQEIEIELSPRGTSALRTKVDLRDPESVGLDLSFAITDATLEGMSEFVALPPDLATGDVGATGTLSGRVRPAASFVAELDGSVRIEAKNGRIRTNLPLLLRLGKATEGYNPFANADELAYELMAGTLELDHGQLRSENFELEGPLRVYANVRLDTNQSPGRIRAVVGIFLFRTPNQIFSGIPLLKSFLPGSDRGLIGAYFDVKGPVDEPDVEPLAIKTLMSSVPDAIKAPFQAMRFLLGMSEDES